MEYPSTVQWRFNWECRFQWGYCVFSNGSGVLNGRRFSGNQHEVNGGAASRQLSDFLIRQRREQQPCRPFCICLTRLLIFLSFLPSFLPSVLLSFFLSSCCFCFCYCCCFYRWGKAIAMSIYRKFIDMAARIGITEQKTRMLIEWPQSFVAVAVPASRVC